MILLLSKHFPLIIIIITLSIIIENSECFSNHETTTNSPDITTINSNGNLLDDLRSFILNLKQQYPIENVTDKSIPENPPSIEIETTKSPLSPSSPPPSIRRRFRRPMLRKISSTNATEPIKIFNGSNRSILQPSSISNGTRRRRLFLRRPTTTTTTTISTITTTESPPSTSMITLDEILEQTITESTTMTPVSTTVSQAITTDDDDDQAMMTTPITTTTAVPTKRPKKICNDIDTKCNNHNTILTSKTINNSRKNSTTRKNTKNSNRSRNRTAKITTKKRNGKQISSSSSTTLPKTSTQTTTTKKKKKIVAQQIVKQQQQPQCEMVVCELPCYIFKTGLDSCPECSCPDPNLDRIQFIATSSFEPAFRLANKRNQSSVFRLN